MPLKTSTFQTRFFQTLFTLLQLVLHFCGTGYAQNIDNSPQQGLLVDGQLKSRSVQCVWGRFFTQIRARFNESQLGELVSLEFECWEKSSGVVVEGVGKLLPRYQFGKGNTKMSQISTDFGMQYPVLVGISVWTQTSGMGGYPIVRGLKLVGCEGQYFYGSYDGGQVWNPATDCQESVLQVGEQEGNYQSTFFCQGNHYISMFEIAYIDGVGFHGIRGIQCRELKLQDRDKLVYLPDYNDGIHKNMMDMQCQGLQMDYCGIMEPEFVDVYNSLVLPETGQNYATCQLAGRKELTPPAVIPFEYTSDYQIKYKNTCYKIDEPTHGWVVIKAADILGNQGQCLAVSEQCDPFGQCSFSSTGCTSLDHKRWFYVHYLLEDPVYPVAIIEVGKYPGWCLTYSQNHTRLTIAQCSQIKGRWFISVQYNRIIHLQPGESLPNFSLSSSSSSNSALLQASYSNVAASFIDWPNYQCLILQKPEARLGKCVFPIKVDSVEEGTEEDPPRLASLAAVYYRGNWTEDIIPFIQFLQALTPQQVLKEELGWDVASALNIYANASLYQDTLQFFAARPIWCDWTGIGCDHNNRIIYIKLAKGYHLPIAGYLSASVFQIKQLITLMIQDTDIGGNLPNVETNVTFLKGLFLADNKFEGPFPHSWPGSMKALIYLQLWQNDLQGEIPLKYFFRSSFAGSETVLMLNSKNDSNICVSRLFDSYVKQDLFLQQRYNYEKRQGGSSVNEPIMSCPTQLPSPQDIEQFGVHVSRKFKIQPMSCTSCIDDFMRALRIAILNLVVGKGVVLKNGGQDVVLAWAYDRIPEEMGFLTGLVGAENVVSHQSIDGEYGVGGGVEGAGPRAPMDQSIEDIVDDSIAAVTNTVQLQPPSSVNGNGNGNAPSAYVNGTVSEEFAYRAIDVNIEEQKNQTVTVSIGENSTTLEPVNIIADQGANTDSELQSEEASERSQVQTKQERVNIGGRRLQQGEQSNIPTGVMSKDGVRVVNTNTLGVYITVNAQDSSQQLILSQLLQNSNNINEIIGQLAIEFISRPSSYEKALGEFSSFTIVFILTSLILGGVFLGCFCRQKVRGFAQWSLFKLGQVNFEGTNIRNRTIFISGNERDKPDTGAPVILPEQRITREQMEEGQSLQIQKESAPQAQPPKRRVLVVTDHVMDGDDPYKQVRTVREMQDQSDYYSEDYNSHYQYVQTNGTATDNHELQTSSSFGGRDKSTMDSGESNEGCNINDTENVRQQCKVLDNQIQFDTEQQEQLQVQLQQEFISNNNLQQPIAHQQHQQQQQLPLSQLSEQIPLCSFDQTIGNKDISDLGDFEIALNSEQHVINQQINRSNNQLILAEGQEAQMFIPDIKFQKFLPQSEQNRLQQQVIQNGTLKDDFACHKNKEEVQDVEQYNNFGRTIDQSMVFDSSIQQIQEVVKMGNG